MHLKIYRNKCIFKDCFLCINEQRLIFAHLLYQIQINLELRCFSGNSTETAKSSIDDVFRISY